MWSVVWEATSGGGLYFEVGGKISQNDGVRTFMGGARHPRMFG